MVPFDIGTPLCISLPPTTTTIRLAAPTADSDASRSPLRRSSHCASLTTAPALSQLLWPAHIVDLQRPFPTLQPVAGARLAHADRHVLLFGTARSDGDRAPSPALGSMMTPGLDHRLAARLAATLRASNGIVKDGQGISSRIHEHARDPPPYVAEAAPFRDDSLTLAIKQVGSVAILRPVVGTCVSTPWRSSRAQEQARGAEAMGVACRSPRLCIGVPDAEQASHSRLTNNEP
ncbi:hypothetical protein AURDEDRAFT_177151 [Auricularia subglabra TFB-10046 SS5]|uniref:Uncharacterized protein n=1 Tax=Auricularia subglabra (strain TFB-10046 / SS5) TaxID=717982 RepID=J0LBE3_AURST|nr:hypothetical protein AURDEDRAFT_177151 [Auricularia subglabra TFB-10046 SS5]